MLSGTLETAGFMMQLFTMSWLLLELTDSLSQLGIMVFLQGMPMLVALIFAGVVADRMDRRKLLILSLLLLMANMVVLGTLAITDSAEVWHIYVVAVVSGVGRGMSGPSRASIIPGLVERQGLMNAVSLSFMLTNVAMLVGPLVAGVVIQWIGIGQSLFLTAGCYMAASVALHPIRGLIRVGEKTNTSALRDLVEGMRYMRHTAAVFAILVLGSAIFFFGFPYLQLMPAFGRDVLEFGAANTSLLSTVMAAGSVAGNLGLAALGDSRHKTQLFLGAGFLFCISLLLFTINPWTWLMWPILFLVGMGGLTFVSMGTIVLQLLVPKAMMGRVMSIWYTGSSFVSLGALPTGLVGDALGLRVAFGGGAIISLSFLVVFGVLNSALRRARIQEDNVDGIDAKEPLLRSL
jgi:MFS family permease